MCSMVMVQCIIKIFYTDDNIMVKFVLFLKSLELINTNTTVSTKLE